MARSHVSRCCGRGCRRENGSNDFPLGLYRFASYRHHDWSIAVFHLCVQSSPERIDFVRAVLRNCVGCVVLVDVANQLQCLALGRTRTGRGIGCMRLYLVGTAAQTVWRGASAAARGVVLILLFVQERAAGARFGSG